MKINWRVLALCFIAVYFAGFIGTIFTSENVNSNWYNQIKPSITPPNIVFPIVWTILYFLIALALYFSWIKSAKNKIKRRNMEIAFAVNLVLNALWTLFYFGMHNILLAFIDIILLLISIVAMIYFSYKIDKKSVYLLVPYLLWVCFATVLNYLSLVKTI
jgi:tryptophan-rich sensory protein